MSLLKLLAAGLNLCKPECKCFLCYSPNTASFAVETCCWCCRYCCCCWWWLFMHAINYWLFCIVLECKIILEEEKKDKQLYKFSGQIPWLRNYLETFVVLLIVFFLETLNFDFLFRSPFGVFRSYPLYLLLDRHSAPLNHIIGFLM